MGRCGKPPARGERGEARRSWARGAGLWDRRLGSCGWGSCGWGLGFCGRWPAVGTWRVGDRRLGFCGLGAGLAPCRSEICGLGLGAWGLPFAIWGWGLRFGRHDVACCLRFGPESSLGFRIWGLGFGRWGLTVYGFGWGLGFGAGIRRSRFAACCLEVAIRGWGLGFAVWGGRNFTVLPGVCGLDALTWLAVCDLALRAV